MSETRDTYKYHFMVGDQIVRRGITDNLERREQEQLEKWPSGHIRQIGRRTTWEAALKWERKGGKR